MTTESPEPQRSRFRRWTDDLVNPRASDELAAALAKQRETIPMLWLLGKTGAGKSSVIQRLTGDTRASIGNGFEPCTRSADAYDHPADAPVMRFLDTRGLGETGYEPDADLAVCRGRSHALLILTRVDDSSQVDLLSALSPLAREQQLPALHVHTALHALESTEARQRAIAFNREQIRDALGRDIPQVEIDFLPEGDPDPDTGLEELRNAILDLVPALQDALYASDARNAEHAAFLANRREVLGYATAAAAVDALPAIGIVGVPTVQGKLLHALAARYQYPWDRRVAQEFLAVLGSAFLYRYGLSFLGRELAKFIPVYGQSAGAAAAAGISFASTYALGRTACLYLYRRSTGATADRASLQNAFKEAFREQRIKDEPR